MPYSYPWNNAVPAGSDLAAQLDTFITDMKNALTERLEDKLVSSMTADPWVVKPAILGNVTGKTQITTWCDFDWNGTSNPANNYQQRNTINATLRGRAVLQFPPGTVITDFNAIFAGNGTDASTIELIRTSYAAVPTEVTIATLTRTNAAVAEEVSTGLNETVPADTYYLVLVTLENTAVGRTSRFQTVKFIYDTPDCRNTL